MSSLFTCFFNFLESHTDPQGNTLAVRSELEEITFKTGMECNYARNPFTCQHVMVSAASEDVVQHIPQEKRPLSSAACLSERLLPHGHGSLKTEAGKLIYCGDWKKGKTNLMVFSDMIGLLTLRVILPIGLFLSLKPFPPPSIGRFKQPRWQQAPRTTSTQNLHF